MPQLLEKYHTGEFFRGVLFPIGRRGSPVKIGNDLEEVFSGLLQLFNTAKGERLMYPEFGSSLRGLLWEPHDALFRQSVLTDLRRTIARWEPRVILRSVVYDPNPYLLNLGILIMTLELIVVNNPSITHSVLLPLSSQGTFIPG